MDAKQRINPCYRYEVRPRLNGWGIWDREEERWLDRALDRQDARAAVRDLNDPEFEPMPVELADD